MHVFQPINISWWNLIKGHPRNISTKSFENRPDTFGGEDFLSFLFSYLGKIAPPCDGHVFLPINMAWRNLIEGHPWNISTKNFENLLNTFGEEDFLSFHYCNIRQNSPGGANKRWQYHLQQATIENIVAKSESINRIKNIVVKEENANNNLFLHLSVNPFPHTTILQQTTLKNVKSL